MTAFLETTVEPAISDLNSSPTVAVIIPAFNEEQGIGTTINDLRRVLKNLEYQVEIVVVDDGSTDETAAKAELCGVRVVRHLSNCGYGASLKSGIRASDSEYILITDADGTYPAEAIPELLALAHDADMVVGARAITSAGISRIRRPAKWILNRLAQYLAGRKIPDLNSGLRVFRRSVLLDFLPILPEGFSFTTTVTLGMLCTNRRVKYVPIDYRKRLGNSKIRPFDFVSFLVLVLRTIVLFNPLRVFLPVGATLFLLGMAKTVYDICLWNLSESAVMAILAAVLVWSVGLLADMIGRLHLRPSD